MRGPAVGQPTALEEVIAVFDEVDAAERGVRALLAQQVPPGQVRMVMRQAERLKSVGVQGITLDSGTQAEERGWTGLVVGGLVGGLIGLLVGLGFIAIPGLFIAIVAGPLVAILAGIAVGAFAAALLGGLIGLGRREPETRWYEQELERGHVLVEVQTPQEYVQQICRILTDHGARRAEVRLPV